MIDALDRRRAVDGAVLKAAEQVWPALANKLRRQSMEPKTEVETAAPVVKAASPRRPAFTAR